MSFETYSMLGADTRNPYNFTKVEQIARDNATAWLTLSEIKEQINLFGDSSQDTFLTSLELAVRQAIEDYLGMAIFATSYRVYYATNVIDGSPIALDLPEISQNSDPSLSGISITSIKYWTNDTTPVSTTVSSSNYYYDNSGNKVIVTVMPANINTAMTAPIYVDYIAAANPIASYKVVKQAGLLLFTHLYNERSTVGDTVSTKAEIPFGVSTLLRPYKPLVM